jgi:hypothetical protein
MSTHLAEAEQAGSDRFQTQPSAASLDIVVLDDNRQRSAATGIIIAVMISTPFWLLVGLMVYLLV